MLLHSAGGQTEKERRGSGLWLYQNELKLQKHDSVLSWLMHRNIPELHHPQRSNPSVSRQQISTPVFFLTLTVVLRSKYKQDPFHKQPLCVFWKLSFSVRNSRHLRPPCGDAAPSQTVLVLLGSEPRVCYHLCLENNQISISPLCWSPDWFQMGGFYRSINKPWGTEACHCSQIRVRVLIACGWVFWNRLWRVFRVKWGSAKVRK